MEKNYWSEWLAGGAAAICVSVGIYAGNLSTQLQYTVSQQDYARLELKVEYLIDSVRELRGDVKRLERLNKSMYSEGEQDGN